jgi:hypothetical protein
MKMYTVTYSGINRRFRNLAMPVLAESEREAVIKTYRHYMDDNYFAQPDGRIFDADGECIADADDNCIWFDGGYFEAAEVDQFILTMFSDEANILKQTLTQQD